MNYNVKVFSEFLYENKDDTEIASYLKECMNTYTREAISFVKTQYLKEADEKKPKKMANADYLRMRWDEMVVADTKKILDKRDALEKSIANNTFDPEDAIDLTLDVISVESALPVSAKTKEAFTNELRAVDDEKDDTRKKRIGKILAFHIIKLIDEAKGYIGKTKGDAVKAIVTKEGKTILEPTKGKNSDSAVRNEVIRVVDQAGRTAKQELDSVERMTETETHAKIYATMLFKEFRNEQFEGTNKATQFDKQLKDLLSRKEAIIAAANKKGVGDDRPTEKELTDWHNLNIFTILQDLRDYGDGKNKMSLPQVKAAIKKLKQSNLDALELVNKHLTHEKK